MQIAIPCVRVWRAHCFTLGPGGQVIGRSPSTEDAALGPLLTTP